MALLTCPECQGKVSDAAPACPHCGFPIGNVGQKVVDQPGSAYAGKDPGFVYVLLNASMPGLVKIGKTSRNPGDRIGELSAATGVPTPFVEVYRAFFPDCSAAETFVHTLLSQQGYRVSDNREFFNAPVQKAVDAVIQAHAALPASAHGVSADPNST